MVVYTDVIQAVVLLLGSCLMTYFVFAHPAIDFSWAALTDGIGDPAKFSVVSPEHRPLNDPKLPWLGTLIGVPILGFYFWVTNQFIVQRVLGARSVDDARWGALLGGLLKLPVLFIMVLPGLAFSIIWAQDNRGHAGGRQGLSPYGDLVASRGRHWARARRVDRRHHEQH